MLNQPSLAIKHPVGLRALVGAALRAMALVGGVLAVSLAAAAPTANLTAPANNAIYLSGGQGTAAQANVTVQASAAAEPGRTIQRVDFYANGNLIGTDPTATFRITWSNVAPGSYSITAKAVDSANEETESAPRTITVNATNTLPTAVLNSPPANARYNIPVAITLGASVSAVEVNDSLTQVEYFLNGTSAGIATASPWRYIAINLSPGTYVLTATATDAQGGQTTTAASRTFTVQASNTPPTAALTAPANNGVYLQTSLPGGVLNITATAASPETNGSIQKVEFFANGVLLGEDTTSPYAFAWSPSPGTYTLTSRSTDDMGAQTTSAPRTVTITATNQPPTSTLTAPANNGVYKLAGTGANGQSVAPLTLNLAASSTNPETNGTVVKVEFYAGLNGGTPALLGEDTSRAFTLAWTPTQAGVYAITAKAIDDLGAETISAPRTYTINAGNTPPVASLSSPANNAFYNSIGNTNTADVVVRATATPGETNDSIKRVELFLNNNLVQTQTAPVSGTTYEFSLVNLTAATYSYYVRAVDQDDAATNSASRSFTIEATNVNRAPTISLTSPANNSAATAGATVTVSASANPQEVNGTITSVEFYAARNGGAPALIGTATSPTSGSTFSISWVPAQAGTYVISAKATDNLNASTTTTVAQSRTLTVNAVPNQAPVVSVTSPTNGQSIIAGPGGVNVVLTATASDTDGVVTGVSFYNGATLIGQGTLQSGTSQSGTYTFNWNNVQPGNYTITAQTTDNGTVTNGNANPLTTTSAGVSLVISTGLAPTVTLANPGATFTAPASISLTATVADADGTVQSVNFFNGATLIGTGTLTSGTANNGAWAFNWASVPAGNYAITAQATDNLGYSTTSNSIQVTVNAPVTTAPAGMYFIEVDHLGTPRRIANLSQHTVWKMDNTEAFGDSTPDENPSNLGAFEFNQRFPGQYADRETGLSYNYFRDYDQSLGRYVQSDPIGLRGGVNGYSYVDGNPVALIDPEGLSGKLPKNYGKDVPIPDPKKLPEDAARNTKKQQEQNEPGADAPKSIACLIGLRNCEAEDNLKKARMCILSRCTACDGSTFLSGPGAPHANAFDPKTTICVCIKSGFDPAYQGGPPPGLTPPGR